MSGYIFETFRTIASFPVSIGIYFNFWLWSLPFVTPFLVLRQSVSQSTLSHFLRVLCAIGLTYILVNLAMHAERSVDRVEFARCQETSIHFEDSSELYAECAHHINIVDGGQNIVAQIFGWVPGVFYVGLWELLWRIWHRKKIRDAGPNYGARWFSNFVIFVALLFLVILVFSFVFL